jgi:hypothetical protein
LKSEKNLYSHKDEVWKESFQFAKLILLKVSAFSIIGEKNHSPGKQVKGTEKSGKAGVSFCQLEGIRA